MATLVINNLPPKPVSTLTQATLGLWVRAELQVKSSNDIFKKVPTALNVVQPLWLRAPRSDQQALVFYLTASQSR